MSVYREDLQKAVRWLKGNQNDDGGWGEHRSNAMCTTMASYALFETKQKEVNDGINWLRENQNDDGSWNWNYLGSTLLRYNPRIRELLGKTAVNDTAMSTLTLLKIAPTEEKTIIKACNWLSKNQNSDGGFGPLPRDRSDPDHTGLALWSWALASVVYKIDEFDENMKNAADWLIKTKNSDNSWSFMPIINKLPWLGSTFAISKIYTTAEVLNSLVTYWDCVKTKKLQDTIMSGINYIISQQNQDGYWVSKRIEETCYVCTLAATTVIVGYSVKELVDASIKGIKIVCKIQDNDHWSADYRHTETFNTTFAALTLAGMIYGSKIVE